MKKLSLTDSAAVAEISETAVVVISLLIVAFSLERNAATTNGESANDLHDSIQQIENAVLSNTELAMITKRGRDKPGGLSESESELYGIWISMHLDLWDRANARENEGIVEEHVVEYWHDYSRQFFKRNLTNEMWEDMKWGWPDGTFRKRVTGGDQCVD